MCDGDVPLPSNGSNRGVHRDDCPINKGESVIWSKDLERLRSIFSKRLCKSQHIVIANKKPENARTTYVRTAYRAPEDICTLVKNTSKNLDYIFYGARVLAFFSSFDSICRVLAAHVEL